MRILLIGEFSRLHNSLKDGLLLMGHEVKIIANGDSFKNFPSDYSTKPHFLESKAGNILRQTFYRLSTFDLAKFEIAMRFYLFSSKLKNFDIVQFINEKPIQTTPFLERFLLKKIFKNNKRSFLLCCGVDYMVMQYMLKRTGKFSILNPYFEREVELKNYNYMFQFLSKSHQKTHQLLYKNIKGVIASDYDYFLPMQSHPKFLGLIANPVNLQQNFFLKNPITEKVIIFLGINLATYHFKGIQFFKEALQIIEQNYQSKVQIIISENIPYRDYIQLYDKAHIMLDQIYAYDQGYNALEAMAKGKVVFTGAEKEFTDYYNLSEKVCINALPDTDYLVKQLSFLIDNPQEIVAIGKRARSFVEKEHDYVKIAEKYLAVWREN